MTPEIDRQGQASIVILGGGPAARFLLEALSGALTERRQAGAISEVVVVEQGGSFATGLPYGEQLVLPQHTLAFNQSVPRAEMGRRQRALFDRHVARLRAGGVTVRPLAHARAVDVERRGASGFAVKLASGVALRAAHVVLATGHWRRESPFEDAPGFHGSPWPAAALQAAVPGDARVAVLGSGLTAIDAAKTIALAHGRFRRRGRKLVYEPRRESRQLHITFYSRNGWLPKVTGTGLSWAEAEADARGRYNRFLTFPRVEDIRRRRGGPLRLDDLYGLFLRELAQAGAGGELQAELPGLTAGRLRRDLLRMRARWRRSSGPDLFRRDFERARRSMESGAYIPWQSVLWEKIELLNCSYSFLDGEEREIFLQHETALMRFLQQVNFDSAEKLMALFEAGCLDLVAVGERYLLAPRDAGRGGWTVTWEDGRGGAKAAGHPCVVDATGQPRDLASGRSALHQRLVERGLVQPALVPFLRERAPFAAAARRVRIEERLFFRPGGVHVNPETFEAIPRGEVSLQWQGRGGGLFVIGPPALGQYLTFVGLEALPSQAQAIAAGILARAAAAAPVGDRHATASMTA
jgi:hypothetical protein